MGVRFFKKPELYKPDLLAVWPGIGNIGVMAIDALRGTMEAEEFAEIDPWSFFYPSMVTISNGELGQLEFPTCKFYFKRMVTRDLIFFIGEDQPHEERKVYEMANIVLDVANEFGCQRVYTSGAAITPIHHTAKPGVWAIPNTNSLIDEFKSYDNTVLMSNREGMNGAGNISGLNGVLMGTAKKRDIEGVCLLGEMPLYLAQFPVPYPKASKSVLEVLTASLDILVDLKIFDELSLEVEQRIDWFYQRIPLEIKDRIDQLKDMPHVANENAGPITEGDKKAIMQDIEEFFGGGSKQG